MLRKWRLAAVAVSGFSVSTPVHAQYAIINDVIAFTVANMVGNANYCVEMPEKKIAEARDPAPGVMQQYFKAASGGGGAKSAAFKLNKKTKWTLGDIVADQLNLDKQVDPLAVAGNTLDPEPLRFYRAGDFNTALGQWLVRAPDGSVAGVYTGRFEREKGQWKLRELTISKADDVVEPADAFCEKPGDSTQQRVTNAENGLKWATEELEKKKNNAAKSEAKALAAEQKNSGLAKQLRKTAERDKKKITEAEEALVKVQENHAKAVANAAEIKRLTLPAREAEQFRVKVEDKPAAEATT